MTTTVIIKAHCASTKQVLVQIEETGAPSGESFFLQDGEIAERYVYDARVISVREEMKEPQAPVGAVHGG